MVAFNHECTSYISPAGGAVILTTILLTLPPLRKEVVLMLLLHKPVLTKGLDFLSAFYFKTPEGSKHLSESIFGTGSQSLGSQDTSPSVIIHIIRFQNTDHFSDYQLIF